MAGKRPITIDQLLRLRDVSDPQPSPDGTAVAYVVSELDEETKAWRSFVWRVPADGGPARRLTGCGGAREPRWSPDGRHLAFVSRRGDDGLPQVFLLAADGGEARALTAHETGVRGIDWAPDGDALLFLAEAPPGEEERRLDEQGGIRVVDAFTRLTQVWTVDVGSGACRQITRDRSTKASARWSPRGGRIAYEQRRDPTSNQSYRAALWVIDADGRHRRRLTPPAVCATEPRWSPDGARLAFLRRETAGYAQLTELAVIDVDAGDEPHRLTADLDRGVTEARWSADGRRLFALVHDGTRQHVVAVSARGGRRTPVTDGDRQVSSLRVAGGRLVYLVETPVRPAEVHTAAASGAGERCLTDTNPDLRRLALGRTRAVRWRSADGLEVEGILVLPVGHRQRRRAPLVVEPHGGPAGARGFCFYPTWQLLAGRGWAVLAPNFRGSAGYGQAFLGANADDFGGGDFADVMAGVDAMVDAGVANPRRLAIMGYSYGGFMTAWAIGQTDRFRAAVAGAGVTNLTSFYGTSDIQWFTTNYQLAPPWKRPDRYRAQSPITHVGRVRTPTLIYHGDEDRRVPMEQSEQLYVSLRERGVPVEFVRYPREGHGIVEYWHRRDLLQRLLAWLRRWAA